MTDTRGGAGVELTVEALTEALTDHWTQLNATAWYVHSVEDHAGEYEACPKRVCRRAREVAATADEMLGLESKAVALRAEMNDALHAFTATLPDDSEPVS